LESHRYCFTVRVGKASRYGCRRPLRYDRAPEWSVADTGLRQPDVQIGAEEKEVMADLYRVTPVDHPVLENGNKLCKGKPVAYVIMWKPEKAAKEVDPRALAFFSGPKFDPGSPDDCGRYTYDSGKL